MFINTECLIQLEPGNVPVKGRSWYCDAIAINFRELAVYLCEVTYSTSMHSLLARLQAWNTHWPALCVAIFRDCSIPSTWQVQPWLFIPQERYAILSKKLSAIVKADGGAQGMPNPRITDLESVTPWRYRTWDRPTNTF